MKSFIKWPLLLLAFVPLFVDPFVFFPYIAEKTIIIRLLVSLVYLLFAVHFFFEKTFQEETKNKISNLFKNRLFASVLLFGGTIFLSFIFAVDKYRAFWGDVERGEGFIGLFFFFSFFILSSIIFAKKDWITFFKFSIITSFILFGEAIVELLAGSTRPGSYTGNPIYLASYFIFSIFCALLVIWDYRQTINKKTTDKIWLFSSALLVIASILGIFITQTRGAIVGLGVALIFCLFFGAFFGKSKILFNQISLRKVSNVLLIFLAVFISIFYFTQKNIFWQKIPGLDRLVGASTNDPTIQTRLISLGVSLKSINPKNEGVGRFLFGWGQENFSIAYNKYYNPKFYEYEQSWFDRAHNKLMDVLVMNGFLGIISYLTIWILFAYACFNLLKKKKFYLSFSLIFFGIAYFIQNLFAFDSVVSYIPFFSILSFAIFISYSASLTWSPQSKRELDEVCLSADKNLPPLFSSVVYPECGRRVFRQSLVIISICILTITSFIFLVSSLVPYFQMRRYISSLRTGDANLFIKNLDSYFYPYTYAQENIRPHFANYFLNYWGKPSALPLIEKSFILLDEMIAKERYNPRNIMFLAKIYDELGRNIKKAEYYQIAEKHLQDALKLSPNRQDIRFTVAKNLALQGKFAQAKAIMEETISLDNQIGESYYSMGLIYYLEGEKSYSTALDYFEKAYQYPSSFGNANSDEIKDAYNQMIKYFKKTNNLKSLKIAQERI